MNTTKALGLVIVLVGLVGCEQQAPKPVGMSIGQMQDQIIAVRNKANGVLKEARDELWSLKDRKTEKEKRLARLTDSFNSEDTTDNEAALIESQMEEIESDIAQLDADIEATEVGIEEFKDKAKQAEDDIILQQKLSTQVRK
jgi:uncharacterized protein YecA (UPF0149 family)